jgi:glucokinase
MILAGDIGGTKTLLGLFDPSRRRLAANRIASFPSREFESLEAIFDAFLSGAGSRISACAVGVAGPVVRGRSDVVNLRWPVDGRRLARRLKLERVAVLNDLEATAWGVAGLGPRKVVSLTPRTVRGEPGNGALIAAGTGLGMALLAWDGHRHVPAASEGGHQTFAPRDELEAELAMFLAERHGRASIERVVSGPALHAIYEFLVQSGRARSTRGLRQALIRAADPNAAVAEAGLAGSDPAAQRTLELFVSAYGAAAGDLALVTRATAGVWVAGGIAPRILPRLRGEAFLGAFRAKGRLTPFMERIPVRVVLEPRTALFGAAACAAHHTRTGCRRSA